MFRKMRREKQALSLEECIDVLHSATSGVLAVTGDDGYPYAVPLSYVYHDNKIYFHSAKTGHKLDAIAQNSKVSFCVVTQDDVIPEEYTTHFCSVIVFGKARVLQDEQEKRTALTLLAARYSPQPQPGYLQEIDAQLARVCMVEIAIEHISGKQAKELVKPPQNS